MHTKLQAAITLDVDWASDETLDYCMDLLARHKAKATWFITHASGGLKRIRAMKPSFDIGIHPNFLPHSTQGRTEKEIVAQLLKICPEAKMMRTHSLVQSTPLLARIMRAFPAVKLDVSLLMPYAKHVQPFDYFLESGGRTRSMLRAPYIWEDAYAMNVPRPDFHFDPRRFSGTGIKIFNFHPIHIALNSADMAPYRALKKKHKADFSELDLMQIFQYRQNKTLGTEDFLLQLLNHKNVKINRLSTAAGL